MPADIYFATKNAGKLAEIRDILAGRRVLSINDIPGGDTINIIESGSTFEENAIIKAEALCGIVNAPVLADDSGLEIDYLGGAPGVLSARYLGEDTPYTVKNNHILELLKDVPFSKRGARFVCVIAYARPGEETITTRGVIEGVIADKPAGDGGFGYDPIFFLPQRGMTTAELPKDEKNEISHRGIALRKMAEVLCT